jgi:hypothetical protein
MNPYPTPPIVTTLGEAAYWIFVILLLLVGVFCVIMTLRSPRRIFVYLAAAALAVALLTVAIPGPNAPLAVAVVLGVLVLALATLGGGPATQLVLAIASRGTVPEGRFGGILVADHATTAPAGSTREILRGGTTIGILERIALAGSILAGFPQAIAVIVAIKSVGRLSELNESEARERFIIGTLVSLGWASACAGVWYFATR